MISYLTSADMSIIAFIGVIFAFALTCIAIAKLNKFLPKDLGRQFAVDGKLSAGNYRHNNWQYYYFYIHICDIGSAFLTNQCGDRYLSCAYSY